jgi:hypothetical protein
MRARKAPQNGRQQIQSENRLVGEEERMKNGALLTLDKLSLSASASGNHPPRLSITHILP